jgi:membrane-bound inhibitor of C-type lysozyme
MRRLAGIMAVVAAPGLSAGMAAAGELSVVGVTYACERGVTVPVTYVNDGGGGSVAVLWVEGRHVTLLPERAASGVRYGWPSGGSHYVWWSKGQHEATLYWHDGETGTDTVLLDGCQSH